MTEPTARWVAWDELPTTIATTWLSCASRMVVAAAISWSVTIPWRRSNSQVTRSRSTALFPVSSRQVTLV